MTTQLTKSDLLNVLNTIKNNEIVETETQIGIQLKNSPLYYYFREVNNIMVTDYIYNMKTGVKSKTFTRFHNLLVKLNIA
jgi:hypothetical protein